ncbi:MAG TPA: peptidoglycan recognition family protein [Phycisphaerae bacterium]|nr:peptidoglycan recognition family protein [Phycisphaerae bacterium]
MGHAMRALGLNLKHGAEDYPVAASLVVSALAIVLLIVVMTLVRGCEAPAGAGTIRNEQVGGCGRSRPEASGPRPEVSRPPSSLKPQACLSAVAPVGSMTATLASSPTQVVESVGPGGRRFWRATIHHTATPPDRPAERVRNIDADHRARGWGGVGYHFLISEDGTVFPGRPLDRQGAHVLGENEGNLGIAFIGTYTDRAPPAAALASIRRLLAAWGFGPAEVYFHRDLAATECPGMWDKGVLF